MADVAGTTNLVGNISYSNVSQCALVLEDNPVGEDSRLDFESFPGSIEEVYGVNGYREIAADRMPQPGFAAYRGGNWNIFQLELVFRAGNVLGRTLSLNQITTADLESVLIQMENKVRWCQALAFPLERDATTFTDRIKRRAVLGGFSESDLNSVNLGQLTRNDPPIVLVVFGSFLTLRCYLTAYTIKWEGPFHPITAQPYGATVSLSLQRIDKEYPTWESIRNQAGKAPQSPYLPRVAGNVVLRNVDDQRTDAIRGTANAEAVVAARTDLAASTASFLSGVVS